MTAAALVNELSARGVRFIAIGDRLRIEARRGILAPVEREALMTYKAAIIVFLAEPVDLHLDDLDRRVIEAIGAGETIRLGSIGAVAGIPTDLRN